MHSADKDPIKRWREISEWYVDFAATPNGEIFAPMVDLTAWVGRQPFAVSLFPSSSLHVLYVSLHGDYLINGPTFSCNARSNGSFEFDLYSKSWRRRDKRSVALLQLRQTFVSHVTCLHYLESGAEFV